METIEVTNAVSIEVFSYKRTAPIKLKKHQNASMRIEICPLFLKVIFSFEATTGTRFVRIFNMSQVVDFEYKVEPYVSKS